jgi:phospholipid transport system substrate-binding protein
MTNNPMMRTIGTVIFSFAAVVFLSGATTEQSPNDVITEAMDLTEKALDGKKEELAANPEELHAAIDEILLPRFYRRGAARYVLAKHARTATPEQLDAFTEAFYASMLRRYADGVLEFDSSKIEILPFSGDLTKRSVRVKTKVTLDDGNVVPVDYRLVSVDDRWQIMDVVIEGISYLTTFRSELDSELRQKSLDEVIDRLNNETNEAPAVE